MHVGRTPEAVEITAQIMREMERGLKCSRRERERMIRTLRRYGVPVTPKIEKILADMDKYLAEWYTVIQLSVTETYTLEEEILCTNCKPVKPKKKTQKKGNARALSSEPTSAPSSSAETARSSSSPSSGASGSGKSSTDFSLNLQMLK